MQVAALAVAVGILYIRGMGETLRAINQFSACRLKKSQVPSAFQSKCLLLAVAQKY
jgi:hypothetical protein